MVAASDAPNVAAAGGTDAVSTAGNPITLLLLINVFLFLIGMVMDLTPNVLIFAPVFYPLILDAGIDPYHFGLIFILNLGIGVITPPVGTVLFTGCKIGGVTIEQVFKTLLPYFAAIIIVLMLVTFIPVLSEFIPHLTGYI